MGREARSPRRLTTGQNRSLPSPGGSVARGDETATSDVDFLVEFEPKRSLFDLLHLQDDLSALLDRPVDVVSVGGLKERDVAVREAVRL